MDPTPLKKPVRVGFWRRDEFRPLATIGVASDGGVWVAPAAVRDYSWTYGVAQNADPSFGYDLVTVEDRPKLHYHRSGRVFVTLTGSPLPRRELRLPSLANVSDAQIM